MSLFAVVGSAEFERLATSAAQYIPEAVRQYLGLQTVIAILAILIVWQVVRAIGTVWRLSENPLSPRVAPRLLGFLGRLLPHRLVILGNCVVGLLLVVLTIQLWAMPEEHLAISAGRYIVPYESVQILCTAAFGVFWVLRDIFRRRELREELRETRG